MRIMFISVNRNQTSIFTSLFDSLSSHSILLITIERNEATMLEHLKKYQIVIKSLDSYNENDVKQIIDLEIPEIVIVGNDFDDVIPQAFVEEANHRCIPTPLVQDGFIGPFTFSGTENIISVYSNRLRSLVQRFTLRTIIMLLQHKIQKHLKRRKILEVYGSRCSVVTAWDGLSKKIFVETGLNPKKIIITGNPKLDRIDVWSDTERIIKRMGLDRNKKIILYAPTELTLYPPIVSPKEFVGALSSFLDRCENIKNTQIIIKPHPTAPSVYFEWIPQRYPNVRVIRDIDIRTLLSLANVVITDVSTVAFEALVFKKPLGIFWPYKKPYPSKYVPAILIDKGVALAMNKPTDVCSIVESLLFDKKTITRFLKKRDAFLGKYSWKVDGRSAERVGNVILDLVERKKHRCSV